MPDSAKQPLLIDALRESISTPERGLGEALFLFVSELTPMVNVDLLIRHDSEGTLLVWRDDGFYPSGWHVPGGVVRLKERFDERVHAVALSELGAAIADMDNEPCAVNQTIREEWRQRGHFVSLLFRCRLAAPPEKSRAYVKGTPINGQWAWHRRCPEDLIQVHHIYHNYIGL